MQVTNDRNEKTSLPSVIIETNSIVLSLRFAANSRNDTNRTWTVDENELPTRMTILMEMKSTLIVN